MLQLIVAVKKVLYVRYIKDFTNCIQLISVSRKKKLNFKNFFHHFIFSISLIFNKHLSNSSKFSLKAKLEIEYIIINNNTKGKEVITEALLLISKI